MRFDIRGLNLVRQCRNDFGVSVWRCPSFLFILIGLVVIISVLAAYSIAANYGSDPEISALSALVTAAIVFVIGHIIIHSFTKVVELNRLKSKFLDIVSHQLLTPLTSLKWVVSMLEHDTGKSDAEKLGETFGMIKENSNKMVHIVNTLLDISRLETGKVALHQERVDLVRISKDIIASRKNDLAATQHTLELRCSDALPSVRADGARTKMVIEHLIDNAIKYSKLGSPIVVTIDHRGNRVVFEIKDSGVGIPQYEHKHIFQKFFRASNELRYQTRGLGVGLFLAKFIIEALGGEISFESEEGIGSRFWFSLPVYTP